MSLPTSQAQVKDRPRPPGATRWGMAAVAVFLLLLAARWQIVASPPYYDFALGLFTEANYLVESNFDYVRLAREEPVGNDGGARVYLISIMPTLLAMLMKAAPSTGFVLVVCHLVIFACASVLIVALFALIRPYAGRWPAIAAVAILVTSPLFSTQVDMLSIDLPMTTAAVVTFLLATRQRLAWAALAATLAFAIKPSALIVTAALVGYELALLPRLLSQRASCKRDLGRLIAATLLAVGLLFGQIALYRASGLEERLQELARASGYLEAVVTLCPDQVAVFLVALVATIGSLFEGLSRHPGDPLQVASERIAADRGALLLGAWLLVAATIAAITLYVRVYSVRYLLLAVPFLYVVLALTALCRLNGRSLAAITVGAVAFNLANWNGYFFPAANIFRRHCSVLERSHEYLADHRSNIAAMHCIEAQADNAPVVAGFPFPYFLSYPRLGYVARPLRGYSINHFSGTAFSPVARLFDDLPPQLVFIRVDNPNYESGAVRVPPPPDGDSVLYDDRQASPLVVYRRSLPAAHEGSQASTNWLLNELWLGSPQDANDLAQLLLRARWLGTSHPALALELVRRSSVQDRLAARLLVGDLLLATGQPREAVDLLTAAAQATPGNADIHLRLGDAWRALGDVWQARREFEQAAKLNPRLAVAFRRLGILALQARDSGDAAKHFRRAIALEPLEASTHNALGLALSNRGDWKSASIEFARACELDPTLREAQQNLAKAKQMLHGASSPSGD